MITPAPSTAKPMLIWSSPALAFSLLTLVSGSVRAAPESAPQPVAPPPPAVPNSAAQGEETIRYSDQTQQESNAASLQFGSPKREDEPQFRYAEPAGDAHPDLQHNAPSGPMQPEASIARERDLGPLHGRKDEKKSGRFVVNVELGAYLPRVDEAYNKKHGDEALGAYAQVFGEVKANSNGEAVEPPRKGLITRISFDWNFFDFYGPVSVGIGVGFFRDKADALVKNERKQLLARRRRAELALAADPHEDVSALRSLRSAADVTAFHVVPIELSVGYRFDLLERRTPVPLMPYVRGGYTYGVWWSTIARRVERNDAGEKTGHGGASGLHLELGLMAALDFLSSSGRASRTRTLIYGEFRMAKIGGFGSKPKRNIGDNHWVGGFAVEF